MNRKITWVINAAVIWISNITVSFAAKGESTTDDPLEITNDFAERMLNIIQGPVLKILAAIILLVGVAGLLRGRHKLAISCGLGFLLLVFLPILMGHVAK